MGNLRHVFTGVDGVALIGVQIENHLAVHKQPWWVIGMNLL
jgi:hypothetical protein